MDPKALQSVVEAAMSKSSSDALVTFKPMFGGILAYCDGKPLASLYNEGIALKLSQGDRAELLQIPGAKPLQYEPDSPPSATYTVVPEAFHSDLQLFGSWIDRAIAFVRAQPAKKKK